MRTTIKNKKNWNSASLNLKQFIKKKDLNLVYSYNKEAKPKYPESKANGFRSASMANSAEYQFASFLK